MSVIEGSNNHPTLFEMVSEFTTDSFLSFMTNFKVFLSCKAVLKD